MILVIADGVRWQEVFTGADATLLNGEAGGSWTSSAELKAKYWDDDPSRAAQASLFPFLWETVATQGQIYGNQTKGSVARVTNTMMFSYPGYNEMASGVADPRIDSNEYGPNPNVTVFEWLNTRPGVRRQGRDLRHLGHVRGHLQRRAQPSSDPFGRDADRCKRSKCEVACC